MKKIIILHGWSLTGKKYHELQSILEENNFKVFAPNMPGFGSEPLRNHSMNISDYVDFLHTFYKKNSISSAIIIGHSFGGRIGAKYAVQYPKQVEKIIFTGAPLIGQPLSLKKNIVRYITQKGKIIVRFTPRSFQRPIRWGIYRFIGEWDYYKSQDLQETFKNIIREDASVYIPKIKVPALVLWGENDSLVPMSVGRKIMSMMPNAVFEKIYNAGHGVIYSHPQEFAKSVLSFITQPI